MIESEVHFYLLRIMSNALAHDAKQKLDKLHYIWQGSLLRTLADKHKTRVKKQLQRLRHHGDMVVTYRVGNQERTRHVFINSQR